ncbi:MAG: 4-(cytidine 5'-diphospho)-2-C-methyl-D-erythritol kinase [Clostridiales bacterium]|nr:4-(cytidine 5'-diphospho)-2-C-methyl-D-erythritol kinase [Clostridiales bacterium]
MQIIEVNAYAKINLLLDIVTRLGNGYHSLFMIMQTVDLHDDIRVEKLKGNAMEFLCSDAMLPQDGENIAYKAALAFFESNGIDDRGVKISVIKRIPRAAGLAGGSADAAGVLAALSELYGTCLTKQQLCKIGIKLGADVPFCIHGGTALAQDIGGVLSELPSLPECSIVLAKPLRGVDTKDAYGAYDEAERIRHPDNCGMLHAVLEGDLKEIARRCENVFEQVIDVPERVGIKAVMRRHNALSACMSGSGPTVFGIFEDMRDAKACCDELSKLIPEVFLCRTV